MKQFFASAALLATLASPVSAAVVSHDLWVFDSSLSLISDDGQIAFDPSMVSLTGTTYLYASDGASLSFSIDGQSFDETSDLGAPLYPEFVFEDGKLDFIDYVLVHGENGVDFSAYAFSEAQFEPGMFYDIDTDAYFVVMSAFAVPAVPLPASLPLVALGFGALGLAGSRRSKRGQRCAHLSH